MPELVVSDATQTQPYARKLPLQVRRAALPDIKMPLFLAHVLQGSVSLPEEELVLTKTELKGPKP